MIKNWKERPELFCNGEFYIKNSGLFSDDYPPEIEGIDIVNNEFIAERIGAYINDCQLIARPISDMSDEETCKYEELSWMDFEADPEHMYYGSPDSFLYLLSIGVYPFEDTTDVIFKPTNGATK